MFDFSARNVYCVGVWVYVFIVRSNTASRIY